MADNDKRTDLALSMITSLPRWGSWAASMREVDTPYGRLGYRQTSIMWILRKGTPDDAKPTNTTTGIAAEIGVQNSVITRAGDHLESLGLIKRTTSTEDRRRQYLTLTEEGIKASEFVEELYVSSISDAMADVDETEFAELERSVEVLHTIINRLSSKTIGS